MAAAAAASYDPDRPTYSLPVVHHPLYSAPQLGPGHRFPMAVFERIHHRLLHVHGLVRPEQVHTPPCLPTDAQLAAVHTAEYLAAFSAGALDEARVRRIGFGEATRSRTLIDRTKAEVAGTLLTARLALARGVAVNTAGGTHHAHPGFGSGFCVLNDLAFTARTLLAEGSVARLLIVDLDVHQGDGTAVCLSDEPRAFTFSVHCKDNFPARKAASDLDLALPSGTGDEGYLRAVADVLPGLLQAQRPSLVLYDAGVDVHADDALGRLNLTDAGLARREALVLDTCLAHGVPVAGYVGGGYAGDLDVLADRHCHLHRAADALLRDYEL